MESQFPPDRAYFPLPILARISSGVSSGPLAKGVNLWGRIDGNELTAPPQGFLPGEQCLPLSTPSLGLRLRNGVCPSAMVSAEVNKTGHTGVRMAESLHGDLVSMMREWFSGWTPEI